jgi:hypothetical protein
LPQIKEYNAPKSALRPSDKGTSEWEIVGRRAGPLYNAAGQDMRERARLAAEEIEGRDWTLNYLVAYRRIREEMEVAREAARPPEIQVNFRKGSSGQYPGGSSGTAGGRVSPYTYGAMAGANSLSQIAAYGGRQAPHGSKGPQFAEPPTFTDDIQRQVASEPYSFDDLMTRLTGSPMPPTQEVANEEYDPSAVTPRTSDQILVNPMDATSADYGGPPSSWWDWVPSFSSPAAEAQIPIAEAPIPR